MLLKVMGHPIWVKQELLEPGSSFFIPCLDPRPVRTQLKRYARELNYQFTTRYMVEGSVIGLRVWRVS